MPQPLPANRAKPTPRDQALPPARRAQIVGLLAAVAVSFLAAFAGALASADAASFYGRLDQPDWAPPAWLFGPVWSTLFVLMAVAAWLVWRVGGWSRAKGALSLFLAQLVANAGWSWLFFAWRLGFWALIEVVALWLLILATLIAFARVRRTAAMLLVPYLVWVAFAAVLNLVLWRTNPELLG